MAGRNVGYSGSGTLQPSLPIFRVEYIDAYTETYEDFLAKTAPGMPGELDASMRSEDLFNQLTAPHGYRLQVDAEGTFYEHAPGVAPAVEESIEGWQFTSFSVEATVLRSLRERRIRMASYSRHQKRRVTADGPAPLIDWEVTREPMISVAGYPCQQAIAIYCGDTLVARFSAALPVPVGPHVYGGLPGLILELEYRNGSKVLRAARVDISATTSTASSKHTDYCNPPKGLKVVEYQEVDWCEIL